MKLGFSASGSDMVSEPLTDSHYDDLNPCPRQIHDHIDQELINACVSGNVELIKRKTAENAEFVNTPEKIYNRTPLILASLYGQVEISNLLLATNIAEVNLTDMRQQTALHLACLGGHFEIAKTLIQYGARVDLVDICGETPVHIISRKDKKDLVCLLANAGADLNLHRSRILERPKDDKTALCLAASRGNLAVLEELLGYGADVECTDGRDRTPLMIACRHQNLQIIKYLIKHGAEINRQDVRGKTALYFAVKTRIVENIKVLLEADANPNVISKRKHTAVHRCSGSPKYVKVLELLLAYGGDPNIPLKSFDGGTALHNTVTNLSTFSDEDGCIELTKTLVTYGADLESRDGDGRTAFYISAVLRKQKMAEFLILKGAEINVEAKQQTALCWLLENGYSCFGPMWRWNCSQTFGESCLRMIDFLLDYGAQVPVVQAGKSCFTAFLYGKNRQLIHYLISHGIHDGNCDSIWSLTWLSLKHRDVNIIKHFHKNGFRLPKSSIEAYIDSLGDRSDSFVKQVLGVICNPMSLKQLCRPVVRDALSKSARGRMSVKIPTLELPRELVSFLLGELKINDYE